MEALCGSGDMGETKRPWRWRVNSALRSDMSCKATTLAIERMNTLRPSCQISNRARWARDRINSAMRSKEPSSREEPLFSTFISLALKSANQGSRALEIRRDL